MTHKNTIEQYQFYTNSNGVRFYYKNKKLHREEGPAIVIPRDADKYLDLNDKELYKKSVNPVLDHKGSIATYLDNMYGPKKAKINNVFGDYLDDNNNFWNQNEIILEKHELAWNKSTFFLEGKEYSEEEFKKFQIKKLKDELKNELSVENKQIPPKLKL